MNTQTTKLSPENVLQCAIAALGRVALVDPCLVRGVHTTKTERRLAFISAVGVSVGLLAGLAFGLAPPLKVSIPKTASMNLFNFGDDAPEGDPEGDGAPGGPTLSEPKIAEVRLTSDEVVQEVDPKPIPLDDKNPDETQEPLTSPVVESSGQAIGSGDATLALGAKTHGDQAGLDGDLAAAIGSAIATQIKACWDAPIGQIPDALSITMTVSFSVSGEVEGTPLLTRLVDEVPIAVEEPDAFEQAAINAVERCAPISLPANLFTYWQRVDIEIFSARPIAIDSAQDQTATAPSQV